MDGRVTNLGAVFRLLGAFSVLSVLAGVLMAGVALPAVGAVGSAASGSVDFFNNLPHDFTSSPLAQQSRILDADGRLIANPYDENRIVVSLKAISPWMQKAQIALEDARFYEHNGLDAKGLARAFVSQATGGQVQGASTITQQYVKLTLQDRALRAGDKEAAKEAVEVSYGRKLQELRYAMDVEEALTKEQILTNYLNLAYYGDQAYGVEAAAINYFSVKAKDLTIGQAATLAGIVQQPTLFNPILNPKKSQERRNLVLDRMQALGMATAKEVKAAKAIPISKMINKKYTKGGCHRSPEPYFCAYVMEWLQKAPEMAVLGKTPTDRLKTINQGGLTIRTSLKPAMQKAAQREITRVVPIGNNQKLGGAVSMIEPGTGRVLALAQSSDYAKQQVNWNVDEIYSGGLGFQFGSTAKMFSLVTALERGMSIYASGLSPGATEGRDAVFKPEDMRDDECRPTAPYKVDVHGARTRTMTLANAVAQSDNGFFVNLTMKLGACSVRDTMIKMGMHPGRGEELPYSLSGSALGSMEVTPLTLANAYATLAAGGKYCSPIPITSITTPDRKNIAFKTSSCKQVIRSDVAAGATRLLKGVLTGGTGSPAYWNQSRPAAGKTGTTENNGQVWFVGYTPQISTAVWVGHPQPTNPATRKPYSLNGKCFGELGCRWQVFGGTVTAPVWGRVMRAASEGMPVKQFGEVSQSVANGQYVDLPYVIGMSESGAKARLNAAGFEAYVAGRINSRLPAGTIAATDPSGRALKDSGVALLVSTGIDPNPPKPSASASSRPSPKASTAPRPAPSPSKKK